MKKNQTILIRLSLLFLAVLVMYMVYRLNLNNLEFFLSFRFKKVVAVVVVSILLAYSSITFQTLTHNRLLTPSVMGLDWLYILGQTFIVFWFRTVQINPLIEFVLSITLMVLMSTILFKFFFRNHQSNVYYLVLSGMILGTLFSSFSNFMQLLMDPHEFDLLQSRLIVSFSNVNISLLIFSIVLTIILLFLVFRKIDDLDVLSLGRDKAISLGVDYNNTIRYHLVLISVSTGIISALVGPVSFLSILVASVSRSLTKGFSHRILILISTLLSLIFLLTGLWLIEQVFDHQTTLAVMINFIGGIYFIYLLLKERSL